MSSIIDDFVGIKKRVEEIREEEGRQDAEKPASGNEFPVVVTTSRTINDPYGYYEHEPYEPPNYDSAYVGYDAKNQDLTPLKEENALARYAHHRLEEIKKFQKIYCGPLSGFKI